MEELTETKERMHRHTSKQIAEYIKQWRKSGLSKKAFCESNNINYYTFVGWTVSKKKKKAIPAPSNSFIPVKVRESVALPFAEVYYTNGSRIVFHEAVGARYLHDMTR
jgi:hypothetical protein